MAASNETDSGDLIDLNNGVQCISRGTRSSSPLTYSEEQEHLLDVCPPKLEQKLSLTLEGDNNKINKTDINSESRNHDGDSDDNVSCGHDASDGHVLVTLGHDKVIPILKRIDVVSSDTIKRVKDITKNLETVIQKIDKDRSPFHDAEEEEEEEKKEKKEKEKEEKEDETRNYSSGRDSVDASNSNQSSSIVNEEENFATETFETREINNAFNFLTELDDDEDEEYFDGVNESVFHSDDGPLMHNNEYSAVFRVENEGRPGEFSSNENIDRGDFSIIAQKNLQPKISSARPSSVDYSVITATNSPRNQKLLFFKSYSLRAKKFYDRNNHRHDDNHGDEMQQIIIANGKLRRSLQTKFDRKSWSEGFNRTQSGPYRPNIKFEKSNSVDINSEKPSTSNNVERVPQRSGVVSVGTELEYDDSTKTLSSSSSSSSSSASEVDWSWVEEVESSRAKSSIREEDQHQQQTKQDQRGINPPVELSSSSSSSEEEEVIVFVVEEDGATGAVGADGVIPTMNTLNNSNTAKRMRQTCNTVSNSSDSIVMSAAADGGVSTAKSLTVPGCPGPPESRYNNSNPLVPNPRGSSVVANPPCNNNTSWVRASMRRLRHLRLPEAGEFRERDIFVASSSTSSASESLQRQNHLQSVIVRDRNSLPDIALIAPEILAAHTNACSSLHLEGSNNNCSSNVSGVVDFGIIGGRNAGLRPASAPSSTNRVFGATAATSPGRGRLTAGRSRGRNIEGSRRSSVQSRTTASDTSCSTNSSGNSTGTSPASSPGATPQHIAASGRRVCERQRGADREDERGEDDDEDENPLGRWPHALSPALACLGCTLGLFNISRFAILSVQFGANFIVQFLVLSLILGIPLFTLQVCLGQRLAAGAVDMWRISPLFQGVGIALLTAQAFIGIYSIVGISWMFVYFRDSFITKQDRYRWAEPFQSYRDDTRPMHNATSYKLQETVPDYFSGVVLQRHHLNEQETGIVTLKFQVAFNLAVVWMIVFVSLSKGLRSYGKVVYVFTLVPVFGTLVLCAKLLGLTPSGSIHQLFPETVWSEFFINGKSWMAASTEVFLTWGLFGAAAMQIAAHNKHKHLLQRDTSLVVVLTFVVLLLSAFLANTCVQILKHQGYTYTTSSFESISGYTFMHLNNPTVHRSQSIYPERLMNHASFLAGQRVSRPTADLSSESGYQVLRLATELVPATLAILGSEQVSPFWAVLFYFILILFGIAQQLAIWHCVITGIMAINTKMMKLWETTITFFSCACGYVLGLPMATEFGIYVVYYLDYTVGGAWWIIVLYLVEVGAVFAVRGRPHTGEAVVAELFPPTGRCLRHWAGPLLSFTWNVVLPVALMVLSIMIFKSSGFRDLYSYRRSTKDYWPIWARQLGAAIQLIPILMIPVVAVIQTCRYLNSGPPDIFDRIQLLYRPSLEPDDAADPQTQIRNDTTTSIHGNGILPSTTDVPFEDPPPKYTPPPSYTTATGARIAKMLRQSFRRSVRRIANVLGEGSTPRQRPVLQPPPPDYATVLVEMNQGIPSRDISIIVTEAGPDVTDIVNGRNNTMERRRPNTIDRTMRISSIDRTSAERSHSTMERSRRPHTNNYGSSNLTAADVANLLRSSIRRGTTRNQQSLHRNFGSNEPTAAVSIENLVEAAAPIGQDSLVLPKDESLVFERDGNDDKKTVDQTENATTVI